MTTKSKAPPKPTVEPQDVMPPPPDGGYGWIIVLASFFCNMIVDGITYTFGVFLSDIMAYYGQSKGTTAWVGSLLSGSCMVAGPVVGALVNKYGCRPVSIVGGLAGAACFALSTVCPNVAALMLVYGVGGGVSFGLIYLPAIVCVGYYFESKRSLATGIAVCGSGVGTFAFAPLATFLLKELGWKGANLVLAGIVLSAVGFGSLMKPLKFPDDIAEPVKPKVTKVQRRVSTRINVPPKKEYDVGEFTSKLSIASKGAVVQPMARKDVFYTGSIANLKEFQSQRSLANFRQSMVNITKTVGPNANVVDNKNTESFWKQIIDMSLLKNPVFLTIGISNIFGMAALYVPFVYLVDCAKSDGIADASASFLLSIIGITNTVGRILCGYFADFPQVNALLVNNLCLIFACVSTALIPSCNGSYAAYAAVSVGFAIAVAGYISLSSIILVDLLGLDKLTNAFGLLILFRGAAALVGSPLAGVLFDSTGTYSVPFYVASALFAVAAASSFAVPSMKGCGKQEGAASAEDEEQRVPINEENGRR